MIQETKHTNNPKKISFSFKLLKRSANEAKMIKKLLLDENFIKPGDFSKVLFSIR